MSSYTAWTAVNVLILVARFFQVVHFQARLGLITRTFMKSASDITHFMVLFVFVLVAFAVMGQKLYGRQLLGFKDFSFCLMTLFRLTFGIGDDPYDAMLTANPDVKAFTTVYYLGFVFISSIVLVNIFLAILVDAFAAVKESAQATETVAEGVASTVWYDVRTGLRFGSHALPHKTNNAPEFLTDSRLLRLLDDALARQDQHPHAPSPSLRRSQAPAPAAAAAAPQQPPLPHDSKVLALGEARLGAEEVARLLRLLLHHTAPSPAPPDRDAAAAAPERGGERGAGSAGWARRMRQQVAAPDAPQPLPHASPTQRQPRSPGEAEGEGEELEAAEGGARGHVEQANKQLAALCEEVLGRFGAEKNDAEDTELHRNRIKALKLSVLAKQLDFFARSEALERAVSTLLQQHEAGREETEERLAQVEAKLDALLAQHRP